MVAGLSIHSYLAIGGWCQSTTLGESETQAFVIQQPSMNTSNACFTPATSCPDLTSEIHPSSPPKRHRSVVQVDLFIENYDIPLQAPSITFTKIGDQKKWLTNQLDPTCNWRDATNSISLSNNALEAVRCQTTPPN